jgi:hypothetical protein
MKKRHPMLNKLLLAGCSIIFLFIVVLGIFAFLSFNGKGEPPNLITAMHVTQEFLESIHIGDIELAHSMLSEKFSPPVSVEQFAMLIRQDENIFHTYLNWKICDWDLFISDGYVIDTTGLLYYDSSKIIVQISLHKDSDSAWRIQGFKFRADVTPTPFGLCQ